MKPETWKATEAKKKSTEEKSAWNISWHFKPGQPQRITSRPHLGRAYGTNQVCQ